MQLVHLVALILTALSMALVMTPAAVHRIAEPESVSERFLWMASNLLLAGMVTLAVAVALELYVVSTALTSSAGVGVALASRCSCCLAGCGCCCRGTRRVGTGEPRAA